jgi:hypothetical protein
MPPESSELQQSNLILKWIASESRRPQVVALFCPRSPIGGSVLCDTFHVPAVNFVDNPGFLIGTEKAGTARVGARALMAVYQASTH